MYTTSLLHRAAAIIVFVVTLLLVSINAASDTVCLTKSSDLIECSVNVTEDTPDGTVIFDVLEHYPSIYVLYTSEDNTEHIEVVDKQYIQTKGSFDREQMVDSTTAPYPVQFSVTFLYNSGLEINQVMVKVSVADVDDNKPVFYSGNTVIPNNGTLHVETLENDATKLIATLTAKDYDEGINGTQEYVLGEGSSQYFNITVETPDNGVPIVRLVSIDVLDREEEAHHTVYIIAREGNSSPDSATVTVSINVTDVDDNPPVFPISEYSQVVYENISVNTDIVQVMAEDADTPKYAMITYKISSLCSRETVGGSCKQESTPYPFTLDQESGMLSVSETLNYEDAVSYRVTINAESGSTFATAIVTIEIQDINDHAPHVINYNPSGAFVSEDAIAGSLVGSFDVNDDDSDKYSHFYLVLLDTETMMNSTKFEIQSSSNIYTVVLKAKVDREVKDSYSLQIVATDSLNTSLSSTYDLTVPISDVNDHAPVIGHLPDPIFLKENSPHGTLVAHVNATDEDIGINAKIEFSLAAKSDDFPYQEEFSIVSTTGRLEVEESPDREVTPYMYVKVIARDENGDGLGSSIIVNITVTDINDNAPTITSVILADILVKENETIGSEVLDVDATDKDIGENAILTYSISSSSYLPIIINSTTGVITLNDTLDHEDKKVYNVKVSVSDGYNTPASHSFKLTVLDVNDNDPYFPQLKYFRSLQENTSVNTHVVTVTAEDADSAEFTQITYSFSDDFDHSHFNLNSKTGDITTTSIFDWETIPKYYLQVIANDGNGRTSQVNCNVTVTITDANDEIPRFIGEPYIFTISEDIGPNGHVGTIVAESKEQGDHGKPVYSIINTTPVPFSIDSDSGHIWPNGTIDRETQDLYTLYIKVDDVAPPINDNTTEATVIITDANDNPPVFVQDQEPIELSELHAVNSGFYTAIATDADLYPNNVTIYSLVNTGTQFQIDSTTGVLSLTSSLNYEDHKYILVDIKAQDNLKPNHFTDTMQLNITVLDDNNTNITFPDDFPLQYNIQENVPIDEVILNFTAQDSKGNPQTHLNYYISQANGMSSNAFGIEVEPDSGYAILRTSDELDRETTPSYNLNITITDLNTPPNKVTQFLTINVLDINDNPPKFLNTPYILSFDEEQQGKLHIGTIVADDPDYLENGTITYTLQESSEYFTIDGSSGDLSQLQALDRESIASHEIVVVATDNGSPSKQSTTLVTINVTDTNDHCPEYSPVFITVKENIQIGTVVEMVEGTDADIGVNGEVYFSVDTDQYSTATGHFELQSNGDLVVTQVPDYEQQNSFIYYIKVSDRGEPEACVRTGNLTIQISDLNDNAPRFTGTEEYYVVEVSEAKSFGYLILNIEAVDDDTGLAGEVNYKLESYADQTLFEIDIDSGELKLKQSLDYETRTQHVVTVLAYDNGSPRNWVSRQDVTINVINVDDNNPKFDNNVYSFVVQENKAANTLVGTVRATDADVGANDELTYAISQLMPQGNEFSVSQTAEYARITAYFQLDYETQSYYVLNITANSKEKHTSALIQIYIENLNDEKPVFTKSNYPVTISELTPIGSTLVFVMATDADNNTNDAVSYAITDGDDGDVFYVDSATGEMRLNKQLDYEAQTSYTLTVTATDTGDPPLSSTATVSVTVLNENEHSPVFGSTKYSFTVQEEQSAGSTVGQVTSTDTDADSVIEYTIEANDMFSIDSSTGVIKTKVSIDREVTPTINDLTVTASDGTKSQTVTVAISVVDINDNIPLFANSLYQFSIPFDQSSYESIGKVVATDADSAPNSISVYTLSNVPSGAPIGVNSTTGDIYLTSSLPSNYKDSYKFTMTATDSGDSSFYNQTSVEVFTYTSTDHPPFFDELLYEVNVTEEQTPAEVGELVTAQATDEDGQTLAYTLDNNYQKFTIDSNGIITLTNSLDYETATSYNLTVLATDTTQRTASTTVLVTVINTNDNGPQYENLPSSLSISPVPFIDVDLFQLEASDADGSPLTFSVLSQTNVFGIDSESGTVFNKIPLIHGDNYTPRFRVSDGISNTDTDISVTVATPPSDAPSFTKDTLNVTVSESEPEGYIVHTFTAINNPSEYNIVCCESFSDVFSMDSDSGVMSLKSSLDYETQTQYELVIEARDQVSSTVSRSDYQKVSISVTNVNEYSPVFTVKADKTVNEGLSGVTVITQVDAQDDDDGVFGEVSYSIIDGNTDQTFIIDSTSGVISLASGKTLDRETQSEYKLLVKAQDGGSKSTDLLVTVTVLDLNDSPPTYSGNITIGVYETAKSGDRIAHVRASDPDTGSQIGYSLGIIDSYLNSQFKGVASSMFEINQTTAVVTLQGDLDREKHDLYVVQVSATDSNSVVATTFLHVQVLDVNDNSPVFEQDYSSAIDVHELSNIGTQVIRVHADDEDTAFNSIVLYSLGDDWPDNEFVIDEMSGVIRVSGEILYTDPGECTSDMFTGTVIATDGVYTKTTEVTIRITDVNNHDPQFIGSPYDVLVSETAAVGDAVTMITLQDDDCGPLNSGIDTHHEPYYRYPHELFSFIQVNSDTRLYELRVKAPLVQGVYRFRIQGVNSLPNPYMAKYVRSGFGVFTVTVLPENYHTPVFKHGKYNFTLYEDVVVSHELGSVTANDSDIGAAGNIIYSILTEHMSPFTIDPVSGTIRVSESLDYEVVSLYTITVLATDGGYPTKTANATIVITLIDVNDNPPLFDQTYYQLTVPENTAFGVELPLQFLVTDEDNVTSNTVQYGIEQHSGLLPFDIDSRTGVMTVSDTIDYEQNTSFDMVITVTDTILSPQSVSSCRVVVNVTGVNEFPPVFPVDARMLFVVDAGSDRGDYLGTVRAVDGDRGIDGVLTYSFSREPNPSFFVISSNGSVYLSKDYTIDNVTRAGTGLRKRQTNSNDTLSIVGEVEVTDGGLPPRSARANITVTVPRVTVTPPITVSPGNSLPVTAIGGIGGGIVFILVLTALVILVVTVLYKRSRRRGKQKFSPGVGNPHRTSLRTPTPASASTTSQVELHRYVSTTEPAAAADGGQTERYMETELQQTTPIDNLSESPDGDVRYRQYGRPTRSTSDLASSVATDTLNLTQETGFPQYSKAQLEQIYATNMNLLTDHSQDSVHMFGSEGGGEAEGDEMDDMMFVKYGVELEEGNEDAVSYCGKSRNSLISECSEEARDVYQFSQSTNPWSSRHSIVDRSMNELASEGSRPMMYHFESSQPAVLYGGGPSTQGSTVSLTRSLHQRNTKYGSERDIPSHQYPPPHHPHHHHHHHHHPGVSVGVTGHPGPGIHHHHHPPSHVSQYEYYPEVPHPHRRGSPIMEYRSESKKLQEIPPPPYLSQDPMYYRGNQYYQHTGSSISPDPNNQPQYETLLSTSSTSLSTNASQSQRRHYLPPMARGDRHH